MGQYLPTGLVVALQAARHGVEAHLVNVDQQRLARVQLGLLLAAAPPLHHQPRPRQARRHAELGGVARPLGGHEAEHDAGVELVQDGDWVLALQLHPGLHLGRWPGQLLATPGPAHTVPTLATTLLCEIFPKQLLQSKLRSCQLGFLLGPPRPGERLVHEAAGHLEGRVVGCPRHGDHLVLRRPGRREHLVQHHHGVLHGHVLEPLARALLRNLGPVPRTRHRPRLPAAAAAPPSAPGSAVTRRLPRLLAGVGSPAAPLCPSGGLPWLSAWDLIVIHRLIASVNVDYS